MNLGRRRLTDLSFWFVNNGNRARARSAAGYGPRNFVKLLTTRQRRGWTALVALAKDAAGHQLWRQLKALGRRRQPVMPKTAETYPYDRHVGRYAKALATL